MKKNTSKQKAEVEQPTIEEPEVGSNNPEMEDYTVVEIPASESNEEPVKDDDLPEEDGNYMSRKSSDLRKVIGTKQTVNGTFYIGEKK